MSTFPPFLKTLLSFGSGSNGQIPYFGFKNTQSPQQTTLPNEPEQIFSDGTSTVFAKTAEGQFYSWGRGENYVLGNSNNVDTFIPQHVPQLPKNVEEIALSQTHAVAFTSSGEVYTWGARALGRGIPEKDIPLTDRGPTKIKLPIDGELYAAQTALQTRFNDGNKPNSIAAGCNHTLISTQKGQVWGFGSNFDGALGLGPDKNKAYTSPTHIPMPNDEPIHQIYSGNRYSLFKAKSGKLFGCGDNTYGQVGVGDVGTPFVREPTEIPLPSSSSGQSIEIDNISAGPLHACFTTRDGELYCWGHNLQAQLGLALQSQVNRSVGKVMTPTRNEFFKNKGIKIKKVKCGVAHTAVLDSNNQLYLFGSGKDGQLANLNVTSTAAHDTPFHVPFEDFHVLDIELGANTTYLVARPNANHDPNKPVK